MEGEPEVDVTKVDSTMRIEEYDDATQGAIRKIMFDQKQKSLGEWRPVCCRSAGRLPCACCGGRQLRPRSHSAPIRIAYF